MVMVHFPTLMVDLYGNLMKILPHFLGEIVGDVGVVVVFFPGIEDANLSHGGSSHLVNGDPPKV